VLPFFVIGEDQKVGCCGGAMPVTHDSWMHFNQMNAFWSSLSSGIVYPRWDENTHGYGAPTTSFYPPGVYYLTSVVYFVVRDWWKAWAGFYWLTMLASAAAIFVYARQSLSRGASMMAAAVYVFAPYHLLNQYQRGAISEFTSFVWIPLCLLFAEKLFGKEVGQFSKLSRAAGLAASFGAFLWAHPPAAYQFLLVFGSCFLASHVCSSAFRRSSAINWRGLAWITAALIFGSMLAAAYFYPAIVEQRLVNSDDVEQVWPYHASYAFDYSQTVYDRAANPFFVRLDRIWVFNLVAIVVCGLLAFRSGTGSVSDLSDSQVQLARDSGRLRSPYCNRVWLWITTGLLASFLMTKYSAPISRLIPKIEIGVYSWRMLTLTSFAMAMLTGLVWDGGTEPGAVATGSSQISDFKSNPSLPLPVPYRWVPYRWMILIGALAMSGYYVAWPMWRSQSFEPNLQHYNYATLPREASRDNPPMPPVQFAAGKGSITIERWTPEFRQLQVNLTENDQLQFRTRNFAGWTA
ncbi:MAG: hypothetical protein ACRD82_14515, partial [Blastocatellia bacterium]